MPRVTIHPPRTPVTTGSNGVAAATLPNVCKMPGPPAPFVPVPLPNVGMSGEAPRGYSRTVTVEGDPVAIQGATFGSKGDIASKPQGGGIVSGATHGLTRFIGPGTLDVRIEGKGVHLLGDPTLNNCGPGGSPANAATMAGIMQGTLLVQASSLGLERELQEICDLKCDCQARGGGEQCVWQELMSRDEASGYTRNVKPQVPYDLTPDDGGPPRPYMSENDPRRATTNWFIPKHRRPDAVIVRDGTRLARGENIRAVVELKMRDMGWGVGQREAYVEIAGGREKLVVMDDENCRCPNGEEPEPEKVPVMVDRRARARDQSRATRPVAIPSPVAALVGALAAAALVVALVASAPATATAAAAVALFAVTSRSGEPAGGSDAI